MRFILRVRAYAPWKFNELPPVFGFASASMVAVLHFGSREGFVTSVSIETCLKLPFALFQIGPK